MFIWDYVNSGTHRCLAHGIFSRSPVDHPVVIVNIYHCSVCTTELLKSDIGTIGRTYTSGDVGLLGAICQPFQSRKHTYLDIGFLGGLDIQPDCGAEGYDQRCQALLTIILSTKDEIPSRVFLSRACDLLFRNIRSDGGEFRLRLSFHFMPALGFVLERVDAMSSKAI